MFGITILGPFVVTISLQSNIQPSKANARVLYACNLSPQPFPMASPKHGCVLLDSVLWMIVDSCGTRGPSEQIRTHVQIAVVSFRLRPRCRYSLATADRGTHLDNVKKRQCRAIVLREFYQCSVWTFWYGHFFQACIFNMFGLVWMCLVCMLHVTNHTQGLCEIRSGTAVTCAFCMWSLNKSVW